MNEHLTCEIVRDLLPSYADGLTSDATNQAVREHLAHCPDCTEALRLMQEPQKRAAQPVPEVDYLKKIHRRTSRVGIICSIVMMLVGMLLIFARVFLVGSAAEATDAHFNISVSGNTVYVSGSLASSTGGVSRIVFDESAGIVNCKLYTAPKAFFNSSEFSGQYQAHSDSVGMVRCGDLILWAGGVSISTTTAQLFAATNPFAGDMPSNGKIASILGIPYQFGPYGNELHTSSEPYGWTLCLEMPIAEDEEKIARDIMTADSYVMLATIGNLGYVTWEYRTAAGEQTYTVTAEEATAYAGQDIKQCAQSAVELQSLMERLSVKWAGVRETLQEDGAFYVTIRNSSSAEIYSFGMNYYLDGKLIGTRSTSNADNSALKQGDEFSFDFAPSDFPADTSAISLSKFSFDLFITDAAGKKTTVRENVPVSAKYAWSYFFSLSDGFGVPYVLNEG
jgi:hypothetical protein